MIIGHSGRDADMLYLRSRVDYNRFIVGHCFSKCGLVALYAFQLDKECIQRVHVRLSMVRVQKTCISPCKHASIELYRAQLAAWNALTCK